jgi:hypothetical protein
MHQSCDGQELGMQGIRHCCQGLPHVHLAAILLLLIMLLLLLSSHLQEAAYHGVPVIGIPLMIGHTELVTYSRDHGRGLLVTKESLLAGDARPLTDALLQIVSNSSFTQQVGGGSACQAEILLSRQSSAQHPALM